MLPVRTRRSASFRTARRLLCAAGLVSLTAATTMLVTNIDWSLVAILHPSPLPRHVAQAELNTWLQIGSATTAFRKAFLAGDAIFDTAFTAIDGVGANVGDGQRFTRLPRADLTGPGEWATHFPERATGPNGQSCTACHAAPVADGAGGVTVNAIRDPQHSGNVHQMIQRNTPHLLGSGALQRLAEEMTVELHAQRAALLAVTKKTGLSQRTRLVAKGIDFGLLRARMTAAGVAVADTSQVEGVDGDLVVRPFQWKGSVASIRDFNRGAAHNEIGMQAVELVGAGVDGDGDGVTDELTVGDLTALTIYVAAQPRPVTATELSNLGIGAALTFQQTQMIEQGKGLFSQIGCAACHVPMLPLSNPVFTEPSQHPAYRDAVFPGGQSPIAEGVRPDVPIAFDLTRDQIQNNVVVHGRLVNLGAFKTLPGGSAAQIELYGDLKRHHMGSDLAENIDETGCGSDVFLTENLWGVGTTAPYLHDGRATTLTEAILWHGGEAVAAREAFRGLSLFEQQEVIAFLNNLMLWKGGVPTGD